MQVALFVTCFNDTLFPEAGRATVRLLERLGHEVVFPEAQTCCGQMHWNTGYRDEALALVRRFCDVFEPYPTIVSPSASCTAGRGSSAQESQRARRAERIARPSW